MGIFAAPAATAALGLAGQAIERSAESFAAALRAATRQDDRPLANIDSLLADDAQPSRADDSPFDLQSLFAAIGL
jgi:hypothetical protein